MPIEVVDDGLTDSEGPIEVADEVVGPDPTKPLTDGTLAVALLSPLKTIEARICALAQSRLDYDLSKSANEEAAREFRRACVRMRGEVTTAYEQTNRPVLAAQKTARDLRDAIIQRIEAIEKPVDDAILKFEADRAAERKRKAEEERQRVASIRVRIENIRGVAKGAARLGSEELAQKAALLRGLTLDADHYGEFLVEAQAVRDGTLALIEDLHAGAIAAETAAAELAIARAESARLRAEQEAAEKQREDEARKAAAEKAAQLAAEEERLAAESRAVAERAAALAAEERAARARLEEELAQKRLAAEQEQARIDAEREQAHRRARVVQLAQEEAMRIAAPQMLAALREIATMAHAAGNRDIAAVAERAIQHATQGVRAHEP